MIHRLLNSLKKLKNANGLASFGLLENKNRKSAQQGFTLVELILVVAIFSFLFGMSAIFLGNLMTDQALRTDGEQLSQTLREAYTRSVSQLNNASWGVKFDSSANPDEFILFQGSNYLSRNTAEDQIHQLHRSVSFQLINLLGGSQEIVFGKRGGQTAQSGTVQLVANNQTFEVIINSLGLIDYN